jgi:hypothetical protein
VGEITFAYDGIVAKIGGPGNLPRQYCHPCGDF